MTPSKKRVYLCSSYRKQTTVLATRAPWYTGSTRALCYPARLWEVKASRADASAPGELGGATAPPGWELTRASHHVWGRKEEHVSSEMKWNWRRAMVLNQVSMLGLILYGPLFLLPKLIFIRGLNVQSFTEPKKTLWNDVETFQLKSKSRFGRKRDTSGTICSHSHPEALLGWCTEVAISSQGLLYSVSPQHFQLHRQDLPVCLLGMGRQLKTIHYFLFFFFLMNKLNVLM